MDFNRKIIKIKYNEYGGSEQKETVILDDGLQYLLKMPDATRELHRELSYINNSISEYVACHILQSLGFEVQNTILGEYTTASGKKKIACACEDIRRYGEQLYELEKISLSSEEIRKFGKTLTFNTERMILNKITDIPFTDFENFYYDLFIADALISNPDRHNGNVGFLSNNVTSRIAPVYDCGSSLHPLWADEELSEKLGIQETLNSCSVISDQEGHRINYHTFLLNHIDDKVSMALKRVVPKINLALIEKIIDDTPYITEKRKEFYKACIKCRYEKTFIPALKKIFAEENAAFDEKDSSLNYLNFYKEYLEKIRKESVYEKPKEFFLESGQKIICTKAGKNHVFCYINGTLAGVLPMRSGNSEVRACISILKSLGYKITLPKRRIFQESKLEESLIQSPIMK